MSKRHQSSRRRSYGRRQHELRERTERQHPIADDESGRPAEARRATGSASSTSPSPAAA